MFSDTPISRYDSGRLQCCANWSPKSASATRLRRNVVMKETYQVIKIHQYSHRKYRAPMWNNFQNFRLKSLLHLKLKSTEFQKGRILPQLLTDPHPGNSEYPKLLKQTFFVPTLNNHITVISPAVSLPFMGAMVSRVQPCKVEKGIPSHVH